MSLNDETWLRRLPDDFVFSYFLLSSAALSDGLEGQNDGVEVALARRITRVSTSQTETRGAARPGGRAGLSTRGVVKDERMLALKSRIDRKLRALARDIRRGMAPSDPIRSGVRRCTRCKKYAESDWAWCPWDGGRTQELDL